MNKTEMIEAVASETGLAKTEVAKVLNAYTNTIVKTVAEGGEYTVIGFGKFYASQRQARTGRNPSTGVEIKIPAAMVPKFTAGKAFKDALHECIPIFGRDIAYPMHPSVELVVYLN